MSAALEVICGPMFSGKTEELIRRLRRAQLGRRKVQAFKPEIDRRYHATRLASHGAQTFEAQAVTCARTILEAVDRDADVVGIDEAQFFGPGFTRDVLCLARLLSPDARVIVSGLDQDYLGLPFPPMPDLLAVADEFTKLAAVCARCGAPATRSQRIAAGDALVLVGAADAYEARCRACHAAEVPTC